MSSRIEAVGHRSHNWRGAAAVLRRPTGPAIVAACLVLVISTVLFGTMLLATRDWCDGPAVPVVVGKLAANSNRVASRDGFGAGGSDGDLGVRDGKAALEAVEPTGVESPVNDPAIGQGPGFVSWFGRDVEYLEALGRRARHGDAVPISQVRWEIARLRKVIAQLDESPSYRDPELGFSVYDTRATGWLHVLNVALRTREELVATRSPDAAVRAADALYRLNDGTPLYDADPTRLPRVDQVVSTLRAMDLPRAAFEGYRVYLLPFSMGDVSGLGADGYMLVGAAAAGREVIANQVPVTVAHELGHHIQLAAMGATYFDNPSAWRRYMSLRGISRWRADGDVNTVEWATSPEETFAEDVRVLFGPSAASQEPYGTAYPDPRNDPELAARLREFIAAQAQQAGLGRAGSVAGGPGPWFPPERIAASGWAIAKTLLKCVTTELRNCGWELRNCGWALTGVRGRGNIKKRQR